MNPIRTFLPDRLLGSVVTSLTLLAAMAAPHLAAATLPAWDFTVVADRAGWLASHDLAPMTATAEGLVLTITGADPFSNGPARNYPSNTPLWLRLRLKSQVGGTAQIFYYNNAPSESQSVHIPNIPAGQWVTARVAVPALGTGYRLRLDPPGTGGTCVLGSLTFTERTALPDFDFTVIPDATEWVAQHDIASLTPTTDGLVVRISGSDPYFMGPSRDYPTDTPLWLHLRMKSEQGGMAQVFYFTNGPSEENSVRFFVPAGDWTESKVRLPSLGAGYRLRIDPPGGGGTCTLASLRFEPRVIFQSPAWPTPTVPALGADAVTLTSGTLELVHGRGGLGEFELRVGGRRFACGHNRGLIGYVRDGQARWLPFGYGTNATVSVVHQPVSQLADATIGGAIRATAACRDPDGGTWQIEQTFRLNEADTLVVSTKVSVDQSRDVLYLPMISTLAGLGEFGTNKTQALLAGVEYLENEPSSSTADLNAPASNRQVADVEKITFPLMTVVADGRYLALAWNRDQPGLCAAFDSPDRFFNTPAHLMQLLVPGSEGLNREESSLIPYDTLPLAANQAITASALIMGGAGNTVIPSVRQYVRLFGLPAVPSPGMSPTAYFTLAARGWLDSQIRDGDRYRHAAPGFGSGAVADAPMYMRWLAPRVDDAPLAGRLETAAQAALALVAPANYNGAQVGHVHYPLPALVFGAVAENAATAQQQAAGLKGRFEADASVLYQKPANGPDYGRTHWARDASGLTASVVASLLENAVFAGDRALIDDGLRYLRALGKFRDTVPRGAQTWEIPLHTPDILGSAYLVRAYTLGYELTRDPDFLEQAKYWAWTGVPFVYLSAPTPQKVGVYSTIPVLGATGWVAPNWIGLPVQWCGLVYADALYRFQPYDPRGPWTQIADGIAAAGIQHTYPLEDADYRGLLPDSYNLRPQSRNGPAINPATVLAPAARLLGQPRLYDFAALPQHGLQVHAPGELTDVEERTDRARFTVKGWPAQPYYVLVNGLRQAPGLRLNGTPTSLVAPHLFLAATGRLVLKLQGTVTVELTETALASLRIDPVGPQSMRLAWPARAPGAVLETADALAPNATWTASAEPVTTNGATAFVVEPALAARQFYRLRLGF